LGDACGVGEVQHGAVRQGSTDEEEPAPAAKRQKQEGDFAIVLERISALAPEAQMSALEAWKVGVLLAQHYLSFTCEVLAYIREYPLISSNPSARKA